MTKFMSNNSSDFIWRHFFNQGIKYENILLLRQAKEERI